jgi:hypothetical protein
LVPDVRDESFQSGLDDRDPGREVSSVDMFQCKLNPSGGSFQSLFPHGLSPGLHLDDRGFNVFPDDRVPSDLADPSLNMRHDVWLQYRRPVHVGRFTYDAFPRRDEVRSSDERVEFGVQGWLGGGRVWRGARVEGEERGEEDEEDGAVEPSVGTRVAKGRGAGIDCECCRRNETLQKCKNGNTPRRRRLTFDSTICSKFFPSTFIFDSPVTLSLVVGATGNGPSLFPFLGTVGPVYEGVSAHSCLNVGGLT